MNQTTNSGDGPWWETEVSSIQKEQGAYLRRRLPAFGSDHDDLLHDTLLALTEHIQKRRYSLPESWFGYVEPKNERERQHLYAVAKKILRRRIADFFRERTRLKNVYPLASYQDKLIDSKATSTDRKMLLARMLEITWSLLDELSQKDRDLVALISDDPDFRSSLSPSERKRLQRLRIKLKKRVARELGAEAADLIRSSF